VSHRYVGRFAPSPTGLLHAGSLVAALASWLDARAHGGTWLVRIEDLDQPRNIAGAAEAIVAQLERLGLHPDGAIVRQSERTAIYQAALARLVELGRAYPCACSRRDLALVALAPGAGRAGGERIYPGTCRDGLGGKAARSMRLRVESSPGSGDAVVAWHDRRLGAWREDVARTVGDFVLQRADGVFAYQLAVVVDDAAQGVTDVVRGEDLAGSTARQIVLQRALGLPTPRYLHTPLVLADDGSKLSKQTGARPLDLADPIGTLRAAGSVLGIAADGTQVAAWLDSALRAWRERCANESPVGHDSAPRRPPHPRHHREPPMQTTPTGLQFDDTVVGNGKRAEAGRTVRVHYTGWLYEHGTKGAKFDSSKDRNDPFEFQLGAGHVIRGWDEGVQGMQEGGTRVLVIPPALGYGARGAGGAIPPNATLLFEVELLRA